MSALEFVVSGHCGTLKSVAAVLSRRADHYHVFQHLFVSMKNLIITLYYYNHTFATEVQDFNLT